MRRAFLLTCAAALAPPAAAGTVDLVPGSRLASEVNGVVRTDLVTMLPYAFNAGVQAGAGQAVGNYALSATSFDVALDQLTAPAAGNGPFAARSTGAIRFSVTDDRPFVLQSKFVGEGDLGWSGAVSLVDLGTGTDVFALQAGDDGLAQPLRTTGTLSAGRQYELRYDVESWTDLLAPDRAGVPQVPYRLDSLQADFRLDLQSVTVLVPLPPAVAAGLAMLGALGVAGWLRRSRAGP